MARTSLIRRVREVERDSQSLEFPSPFIFIDRDPITLIELRMRTFSGMIRSKPDWWVKIHDPELVAKWRQEMIDQDRDAVEKLWGGEERFEHGRGKKQWPRDKISDTQLKYIFEQLKYESSQRDDETGIFAAAIPKVYESRSLIPADLKSALVSGVSDLESVPEEEKDWHPGTNKQVLDLVHPSLYCLRIGESLVRRKDASGADVVSVLNKEDYASQRPDFAGVEEFVSSDYQWLPTDFEVAGDGSVTVQPLGYINNLHPIKHRSLYNTIASVLGRFVPLFNKVLSDMLNPEPALAISPDPLKWYNHIQVPEFDYPRPFEEDPCEQWAHDERWPLIPEPVPFSPPDSDGRIEFNLNGRTVQVIVKLANIHLTPDNPTYPGGSWHVEGMANEKIVATGLYYYACENITESRLSFRTVVGEGDESGLWMSYVENDDQGWYSAFGFSGGQGMNQVLGHIVAEEDKCVAFPNIYQHRVEPFELADPSKPGHRKILCFFLVDPLQRILSTSDVPPQQEDWSMSEMVRAPALRELPVELFEAVADYARQNTISRKEAEEHRERLMKERAHFVVEHNEKVFELEFNMCEH
ncbi:hypothetical protein PYCCODRAFT_1399071 [Trametes coccinea BRFM310]|uniref:Uncharacterized protein n=1 Tax=Trametes coccinea (strain BRFM310) TaxID=1353009 RepID=A0A1Y2I801_TRAC3|nr:hypothetical protein PYCCODRAFT_1399071 [Trametes coccinea BRFM310]